MHQRSINMSERSTWWACYVCTVTIVWVSGFQGCVQVTDLREAADSESAPGGQIDTGWMDIRATASCVNESDCPQGECGTSDCVDSQCVTTPRKDGQPCSDGNPNTVGDTCLDGICEPGADVCLCQSNTDCEPFDDQNQCNGKLECNGCSCVPISTPPGTPCDDNDPLTENDECNAQEQCAGEFVCQCSTSSECIPTPCNEAACDACLCMQYPATLGYEYASYDFNDGLPANWSTTSSSPTVTWRTAATGLRVGNPEGLYTGPGVIAELESSALIVPNTTVVLEVDIAFFSAESTCDDRLEVFVGDILVDSLCGPTPATRRRYDAQPDEQGRVTVRFVFTSDDDTNDAAGPLLTGVRWVRARWDTCGLLPAERVVPTAQGVTEYAPTLAADDSAVHVYWSTPEGIFARDFDQAGNSISGVTLLDSDGEQATSADAYALWRRPTAQALILRDSSTNDIDIIPVSDTLDGYGLDANANGPMAVWRSLTDSEPAVHVIHGRKGFGLSASSFTIEPNVQTFHAPRIAATANGIRVLTSDSTGQLKVYSDTGVLAQAFNTTSVRQPEISAGHGTYAIVSSGQEQITISSPAATASLAANDVVEVDLVAHPAGWFVIWVARNAYDTDILLATTSPGLDGLTGVNFPVAEYSYANQDSVGLGDGPTQWATWRTDWYGADSSTVVLRTLNNL